MESGYYAACTGLMVRTQSLETVANNLANVNTVGFRASHNIFSSLLATTGDSPLSVVNQDANDYGVLSGTRLDTTQGALTRNRQQSRLGNGRSRLLRGADRNRSGLHPGRKFSRVAQWPTDHSSG